MKKSELRNMIKEELNNINEWNRANEFFNDSKRGKEIHNIMKGKWDDKKFKKYVDDIEDNYSLSHTTRIFDHIASDIGINWRKYEQKPMYIFTDAINKKAKELYNEFINNK